MTFPAFFGREPQLSPFSGLLLVGCIGPLFGLQHETAAFVEVNPANTSFAVVVELNGPFKYVGILRGIISGWVRPGNADEVAKVLQKQTIVGAFSTSGRFPAGFKVRIGHRGEDTKKSFIVLQRQIRRKDNRSDGIVVNISMSNVYLRRDIGRGYLKSSTVSGALTVSLTEKIRCQNSRGGM